ncbi:calcium-dependent lipid-binding (CaLB domain) family protein [Tasmannia lanceolata]|uniref:calcium-dependent lipid-binding (CaLB domain) family protein n=1 Tax=Tasmannia lanceolata TaxID=3420 RepID=UPI0040628752
MASPRPSHPKPLLDLDLTIISAKHLKNVNWRHGDLKPYAIFWLDPDRKFATKPDDSGSTRPVWNERFTLPITLPIPDSLLTLEIFHSKPSETPKPLVATTRVPLKELLDSDDSTRIKTLDLRRPSGRPQGKIRIKLAVLERPPPPPPTPDYHVTPPSGYYYSSAPPPRDYRGYYGNPNPNLNPNPNPNPNHLQLPPPPPPSQYPYGNYADPYSGYYSGYYSYGNPNPNPNPNTFPPPPRPFFDRASGYGGPGGPSAPVDFSSSSASVYEQKPKAGGKMGIGAGLAVGAVAGALGGLALEEGLKYEEQKMTERVESDISARDDYSDYRNDY